MTAEELSIALEEKRPEMVRIAAAKLRRHGLEYEAEDFVQEATIKILNGVADDRYTLAEGVGGLFTHIILDLIRDRLRIDRRRGELTDEYTRIYQPDSQAHMRQKERLKIDVDLAMAKLDPQTSRIVRMAWMEDHPRAYICRRLKVSEHTVQAAKEEALPVLQAELARYDHRQRPPSVEPQERVSASQPPYKEGTDETDTASPDGGHGREMTDDEMIADLLGAVFAEEPAAAC